MKESAILIYCCPSPTVIQVYLQNNADNIE